MVDNKKKSLVIIITSFRVNRTLRFEKFTVIILNI